MSLIFLPQKKQKKLASEVAPSCELTTARDKLPLDGWQLRKPPTNWQSAIAFSSLKKKKRFTSKIINKG